MEIPGKITPDSGNPSLHRNSPSPVIEFSEETPPGQECKRESLFHHTHSASMYQKGRKCRSELQCHHGALLHRARYNPPAYRVTTIEDMSKTHHENSFFEKWQSRLKRENKLKLQSKSEKSPKSGQISPKRQTWQSDKLNHTSIVIAWILSGVITAL